MVMAPSAIQTYSEPINTTFDKSLDYLSGQDGFEIPAARQYGKERARHMIQEALERKVDQINGDTCEAGEEDTFFVADLGEVYRQHLRWKMNLSRVKPHYAVKCNPDPAVLSLLAALGTGFDCASKAEIEQVLKLGVAPSRIIYAQPCKTKSYLRFATQQGVTQMTFDNADELNKIKQFAPDAELYLRILTDDSASLCRLSLKFGASLDTVPSLLEQAKRLGLNVAGVAFHVGSGASDPQAFMKAVADARWVFDQAYKFGYDLRNLDVGGGFVSETFEPMAAVLSRALEDAFPPHVRIIGEPGRYFVSSAFTIACNVIARRSVDDAATAARSYMLYLNDGVYGNFSSIIFDHQQPVPRILKAGNVTLPEENQVGHPITEYSIWGPTCDGIDLITPSVKFAQTIDVGDWLFFEEMGAYTKCSATQFNGFSNSHEVIYVCSEPGAEAIMHA